MFTALLDTCVLWPSLQRDVLLSFAVEGIYRPAWSSAILEELEYHEERKLFRRGTKPVQARQQAGRLIAAMQSAFNDSEVEGWEPLEGTFGLPDPDDEHVVAAAVIGGAGILVTHNLKDFPPERIPDGIDVWSPAVFAQHAVSVNPNAALRAIQAIAARSGRQGPTRDVPSILDTLEQRYGLTDAADMLRVTLASAGG